MLFKHELLYRCTMRMVKLMTKVKIRGREALCHMYYDSYVPADFH